MACILEPAGAVGYGYATALEPRVGGMWFGMPPQHVPGSLVYFGLA